MRASRSATARSSAAGMRANASGLATRSTTGNESLPNIWQAAAVLAAYTVVFVALAYWRFRTRDVTMA